MLACCTPGGGAVPGADMPGGAPVDVSFDTAWKEITYPFQEEVPCPVVRHFGLEKHQILEVCHTATRFRRGCTPCLVI